MEPVKKVYKFDSEKEVQTGAGKSPKTQKKKKKKKLQSQSDDDEKIIRIAALALRLAKNGCYDNNNRLIYDEVPLPGSDVSQLIAIVMNKSRNSIGITEFVHILKRIGVNPNLIENQTIRNQLQNLNGADLAQNNSGYVGDPYVTTSKNPKETSEWWMNRFAPAKRTNIENSGELTDEDDYRTPKLYKKKTKRNTPLKRSPYQLRTNGRQNFQQNGSSWIIP